MRFLPRLLPFIADRVLHTPPRRANRPHRSALLFLDAKIDTTLPRTLRRDGWWLET